MGPKPNLPVLTKSTLHTVKKNIKKSDLAPHPCIRPRKKNKQGGEKEKETPEMRYGILCPPYS